MKRQRWYIPVGFWLIFESIAVVLWLTKEQVFYLFNFSYIGTVLTVGLLLFQMNYRYAGIQCKPFRSTAGRYHLLQRGSPRL